MKINNININNSISGQNSSFFENLINNIDNKSRADMEVINNISQNGIKEVSINELMKMNVKLYEMTVRYEIFAKMASKGVQGFENLLRTQ